MPPKTRQHVIPRVFLRAFCDPTPHADHPPGVPFEPSVWLLPRSLDGKAKRKAPGSVFTEQRVYTLATEDPELPEIEEWLSRIESNYAVAYKKLKERQELNPAEWDHLFLFVGALHARRLSQVAHWQKQLSQLEKIARAVEKHHTGAERSADKKYAGWEQIGLRSLQLRAESFRNVLKAGAIFLLENMSEVPFASSDRPVASDHLELALLRDWGVPPEIESADEEERNAGFTCFCPLSPELALFTSHNLSPASMVHWWTTYDDNLIASLMWWMILDSESFLIANSEMPFPEPLAKDYARALASM